MQTHLPVCVCVIYRLGVLVMYRGRFLEVQYNTTFHRHIKYFILLCNLLNSDEHGMNNFTNTCILILYLKKKIIQNVDFLSKKLHKNYISEKKNALFLQKLYQPI